MTLKKAAIGLAVLACALAGAAVAFGAGSTTTTTGTTTTMAGHSLETALTGNVATQAKAAAVAKVGGTADSATTENDSSNAAASYEVHVTKTDGTHVKVILDNSFTVLSVETGGRGGHRGPGGGRGSGETELTGTVATQAKQAAVAKVGGTADGATTENDSSNAAARYEVHVTKTDGTHVKVILDSSFAVLSVETGGPGGHDGFRHDGFRSHGSP